MLGLVMHASYDVHGCWEPFFIPTFVMALQSKIPFFDHPVEHLIFYRVLLSSNDNLTQGLVSVSEQSHSNPPYKELAPCLRNIIFCQ